MDSNIKVTITSTKTITETREVELSEWVREAMAGHKIDAIKALRAAIVIKTPRYDYKGDFTHYDTEYMGLKTAKDIIESMFK